MIAGGAESTVSPLGLGGFASARALSSRNDDPATASRPWDRDRDGFVLGEGAGVMVLEEYEHAKARGAQDLRGSRRLRHERGCQPHHRAARGRQRRVALHGRPRCSNAGINPDQVQLRERARHLDPARRRGRSAAASSALSATTPNKLVVNSTKSMTGHLLGGAGGLEAVFTVLAIHNQVSPPTINIFNQDPACDLDFCANTAREMKIDFAVKNSFGFGGTNGTLVFAKV